MRMSREAEHLERAPSGKLTRCSCRLQVCRGVNVRASHGIVPCLAATIGDLEQMRMAMRGAKHFGARIEIGTPFAPETLVERYRVERLNLGPMPIEALRPGIEGKRIMAPQILDIEDLQAGALHLGDCFREARNPAARKDVLADVELGIVFSEMPDEMQHAEATRLEAVCVRAHDLGDLIASRVLKDADRDALVVDARDFAEVGFDHLEGFAEAPPRNFAAHRFDLLARRVDAGAERLVAFPCVEREAAPATTDIHESLAALELNLAADVLHLVLLSFLQRGGAFLP